MFTDKMKLFLEVSIDFNKPVCEFFSFISYNLHYLHWGQENTGNCHCFVKFIAKICL